MNPTTNSLLNSTNLSLENEDSPKKITKSDIKISSIWVRVSHSRLLKEFTLSITLVSIITVVIGSSGLLIIPLVISILALRVLCNKKIRYEASILHTALGNSTPTLGTEIISDKLSLGPIPLKNKQDHEKLLKVDTTLVLTLLEEFEWQLSSFFSEPLTPEDWTTLNQENPELRQFIIQTEDFNPVSFENIQKSVAEIHDEIEKNGHVYVHCKAGRGRSATAVICYLLKYGKSLHNLQEDLSSVTAAIEYVKTKRPIISINKRQRKAIINYFNIEILKKE